LQPRNPKLLTLSMHKQQPFPRPDFLDQSDLVESNGPEKILPDCGYVLHTDGTDAEVTVVRAAGAVVFAQVGDVLVMGIWVVGIVV
ncbi:MAG: hypothetical protein L6R40_008191, partial [Gallowayella cf. fulva]